MLFMLYLYIGKISLFIANTILCWINFFFFNKKIWLLRLVFLFLLLRSTSWYSEIPCMCEVPCISFWICYVMLLLHCAVVIMNISNFLMFIEFNAVETVHTKVTCYWNFFQEEEAIIYGWLSRLSKLLFLPI